jgi:hypothetical protein
MKQEAKIAIVKHFLLLHDPRVVQELNGVLFLDPGQEEDGTCLYYRSEGSR